MSSDVTELAGELLELDSSEREQRLARLAREHPTLYRRVAALLRAGRRASFLDTPALDAATSRPPEDLSGRPIGPYRLEEKLASGGMADVYRGRRDGAAVAVKVLKLGMDSAAVLRRFDRERRTLAALDHDHIVAFRDAGVLEDGRPFLVMELVEGEHIDAFCRGRPLEQRLRLMLAVCDAVQHAHGHFVVHRDLKPSNVLVTGDGTPKLLDFGIVKLLDDRTGDRTATGQSAPLTPRYASPEQLTGGAITAASDVFSLGVLLGEVIGRRTDDLGIVTATAQAVDPRERYASAAALAADLRRYLEHRPIAARQPSVGYRIARFARRRWRSLTAAAVVLASALTATAIWIDSTERARGAKREALGVSEFLVRLLAEATPAALGADIDLLTAIRAAERHLGTQFGDRPHAEARIRMAYAYAYSKLGRWSDARPHLERSIELIRSLPDFHPDSLSWCQALLARTEPK